MEAEALESIFLDDFEKLSEAPYHWRIKLTPHPPGDEEANHGQEAHTRGTCGTDRWEEPNLQHSG
jgi:hypothetical protein